jgi:hypothetical protein
MKKLFVLLLVITSCSAPKSVTFDFREDINQSIIEGFYNNDTTGIGSSIYLLKQNEMVNKINHPMNICRENLEKSQH